MPNSKRKFCSILYILYFQALSGRQPHFNKSVLDDLMQQPIFEGCDHLPTDMEIIDATHELKNKAPGESGIMA